MRKLAAYVNGRYGHQDRRQVPTRRVRIGRERLREILHEHRITFQRTRTWKESHDPDYDAKLDRIEEVIARFPDRCFAFDQFGPLRMFTMANFDHPNHVVLAHRLHAYLRWRNLNNRHPDVLAAQRCERARVRSERHQRWGRPNPMPPDQAGDH